MSIMAIGRTDEFFLEVVVRLAKLNFPINYFLFLHSKTTREHSSLQDTVFLDVRDYVHCERIDELLVGKNYSLPKAVMSSLAECELDYLTISDRLSKDATPIRTRRLWFWKLASYWFGFLNENRIQILFFQTMPHSHVNMILFDVARILGIKKFFVERSGILDRILLFDNVNTALDVPKSFMPESNIDQLEKCIPVSILKSIMTTTAWQKNASANVERGLKQYSQRKSAVVRDMYRAAIDIFKGKIYPETINNNSVRKFPLSSCRDKWSLMTHHLRVMWTQNELRNYYSSNISKYNATTPHVVFYLNFEPERTTVPMGGCLGNASIAIDTLSRALPNDWILYIKEHPRQFVRGVLGRCYRDKKFYSDMQSHPNVRLINPNISTSEILKNCNIVASISGSIGWEAALAGKPSLLFGYPWYAGCPASFRVDTVDVCQSAITEACKMDKFEIKKQIYRFLAYNKGMFHQGTNSKRFSSLSDEPEDKLIQGVVAAISEKLNSYGPSMTTANNLDSIARVSEK